MKDSHAEQVFEHFGHLAELVDKAYGRGADHTVESIDVAGRVIFESLLKENEKGAASVKLLGILTNGFVAQLLFARSLSMAIAALPKEDADKIIKIAAIINLTLSGAGIENARKHVEEGEDT